MFGPPNIFHRPTPLTWKIFIEVHAIIHSEGATKGPRISKSLRSRLVGQHSFQKMKNRSLCDKSTKIGTHLEDDITNKFRY